MTSSCDFFSHCGFWWPRVPKLTCCNLQISFSQVDMPASPPLRLPAHSTEVGENSPMTEHLLRYRKDYAEHLSMQGILKMILPKWDLFCSFFQRYWGGKNTKTLQNIATTSEGLNQCSWRQHRLTSPSSSHQGRIRPLCKEADRTFRNCSGN